MVNDHFVAVLGDVPVALDHHGGVAAVRRRVSVAPVRFRLRRGRPLPAAPGKLAPGVLYGDGAVHLAHAPQRRADRLVSRLLRPRLDLADLRHRLDDRVSFAREKVFGERVQYVHAVYEIAPAYRYVHGHDLVLVRFVDLQRWLQDVQEVGQLIVPDVPRAIRVEVLPHLVVHVVVIVRQTLLHVLGGLRIVLQDYRDVHVDHNQEVDHQVREQERRTHRRVAAAARDAHFQVLLDAVLLVCYTVQHCVPTGRSGQLKTSRVISYFVSSEVRVGCVYTSTVWRVYGGKGLRDK